MSFLIKTVVVRTRFIGFHQWFEAPKQYAFLRNSHRHEFHVEMGVEVQDGNREIEFLSLKDKLDGFISVALKSNSEFPVPYSCEQMAELLLEQFRAAWVEVSEDGENGAVLFKKKKKQNSPKTADTSSKSSWMEFAERCSVMLKKEAIIKTRCFIGTEAEGPYRGLKTLFIPGCVTSEQFKKVMTNDLKRFPDMCEGVYFGAGNLPYPLASFLLEWLPRLQQTHPGLKITIEVDNCTRLSDIFDLRKARMGRDGAVAFKPARLDRAGRPCSIIVSLNKEDIGPEGIADYYKEISGNLISWIPNPRNCNPQRWTTKLDDPLFTQDVNL